MTLFPWAPSGLYWGDVGDVTVDGEAEAATPKTTEEGTVEESTLTLRNEDKVRLVCRV